MAGAPQMADVSLGTRIRLARGTAGMTMRELAKRIGVHPDSLSDYENDRTDPPAKALRAIAEVADVSADWLLFGGTRVKPPGPRSLSVIRGSGHPPSGEPIQGVLVAPVPTGG